MRPATEPPKIVLPFPTNKINLPYLACCLMLGVWVVWLTPRWSGSRVLVPGSSKGTYRQAAPPTAIYPANIQVSQARPSSSRCRRSERGRIGNKSIKTSDSRSDEQAQDKCLVQSIKEDAAPRPPRVVPPAHHTCLSRILSKPQDNPSHIHLYLYRSPYPPAWRLLSPSVPQSHLPFNFPLPRPRGSLTYTTMSLPSDFLWGFATAA
jgi:hypothetical protein